jgi:hypothetical protein
VGVGRIKERTATYFRCDDDSHEVTVHKVSEPGHAYLDLALLALDVVGIGVLDVDGKCRVHCGFEISGELEQSLGPLLDDRLGPRRNGLRKNFRHFVDPLYLGRVRHHILEFQQECVEELVRGLAQPAHHIVDTRVSENADRKDPARPVAQHSRRISITTHSPYHLLRSFLQNDGNGLIAVELMNE